MNADRRVYKAAAKRLAKTIGQHMAKALEAEAEFGNVGGQAAAHRELASRLSAVLEGLKKQLETPGTPSAPKGPPALTYEEAIEALREELPKLSPGAMPTCIEVALYLQERKYEDANQKLHSWAWQSAAVPLANRVAQFIQSLMKS